MLIDYSQIRRIEKSASVKDQMNTAFIRFWVKKNALCDIKCGCLLRQIGLGASSTILLKAEWYSLKCM